MQTREFIAGPTNTEFTGGTHQVSHGSSAGSPAGFARHLPPQARSAGSPATAGRRTFASLGAAAGFARGGLLRSLRPAPWFHAAADPRASSREAGDDRTGRSGPRAQLLSWPVKRHWTCAVHVPGRALRRGRDGH